MLPVRGLLSTLLTPSNADIFSASAVKNASFLLFEGILILSRVPVLWLTTATGGSATRFSLRCGRRQHSLRVGFCHLRLCLGNNVLSR